MMMMMANGKQLVAALAVLASFLLLSTASATSRNHRDNALVSPFCTKANSSDDKALCTRLVNGGATWPEAMTNAINGVIGIVNASRPRLVDGMAALIVPPDADPGLKDSIAGTCRHWFMIYLDYMDQCLGFVNAKNAAKALKVYITARSYDNCLEQLGIQQYGAPEVLDFAFQIKHLGDILLSIVDTKPHK